MTNEKTNKREFAMPVEQEESSGSSTAKSLPVTLTSDVSQYSILSLPIEGCVYRGEGNANLVVALPSERKVIRLKKSVKVIPGGSNNSSIEDYENEGSKLTSINERLRCYREVEFIRNVISGFLGCYVCVPEIQVCDPTEIARLSAKISSTRPEKRRNKDIVGVYALKLPDYTYLPENLRGFSSKSTYCVEIKPKQGFLAKIDKQFQKCPYCLMQYYKAKKNRGTNENSKRSEYCPFDLFSGESSRVSKALKALLKSPQNNLKIFKDGEIVYSETLNSLEKLDNVLDEWLTVTQSNNRIDDFVELVYRALTRAFDTIIAKRVMCVEDIAAADASVPSRLNPELVARVQDLLERTGEECEMSGNDDLPIGSVLERILRMQKLHRSGADFVTWINAEFSYALNDELIYADLLDVATADCIAEDENVEVDNNPRKKQRLDRTVQSGMAVRNPVVSSRTLDKRNFNARKKLTIDNKIADGNLPKNMTMDDCLTALRNYLLFCTAKDCSILMAFQEVDKTLPASVNVNHRIDLSKDRTFLVNVQVLDLDPKSLECIEKHRRRDNDVLRAVVEQLEKELII